MDKLIVKGFFLNYFGEKIQVDSPDWINFLAKAIGFRFVSENQSSDTPITLIANKTRANHTWTARYKPKGSEPRQQYIGLSHSMTYQNLARAYHILMLSEREFKLHREAVERMRLHETRYTRNKASEEILKLVREYETKQAEKKLLNELITIAEKLKKV